ncbi:hypothetical protein OS189_11310 [Sulfitobacter sp. F26169L]|uniref:hypothetical protein n=1 Tax=Sulfitobacter sp. F26169L TaxID=2996015 RepID=UPI0022609A6D|nr:hypothetical protein [Sulfitobacter sp. F26169L]MCX7566928.1 hypothetical protein [Sulfitobacter sp. F26169L]
MSYALSYVLTPEMQNRAMVSWATPLRSRAEKLGRFGVGALGYVVLVGVVLTLLRTDFANRKMLFSATSGFCAAIAFWAVSHKISTARLKRGANEALARQGVVHAESSKQNVAPVTDISTGTTDWRCYEDAFAMRGASVLRSGASVFPVPDMALPAGTSPDVFRADLKHWIEEAG